MALSTRFKLKLGENVRLALSEEQGDVIGRAEFAEAPPRYFVRYVTKDGNQVEGWFTFEALRIGA